MNLMEILLSVVYSIVFLVLIFRIRFFEIEGLSKKFLGGIFILKILSGTILAFIYTYYYKDRMQADVFKFFDDSKIMFDDLKEDHRDFLIMLTGFGDQESVSHYYHKMNFWFRYDEETLFNDNHTIIRFNAIVRLFSFGYFGVHTVFINFLSFLGLLALFKAFSRFCRNKVILAFCVFFWPSVMFWGSGVLKEGLLLFGLGFFVYSAFNIIHDKFKIFHVIVFVFSLLLLTVTKYYILIIMFPALLSYFFATRVFKKKPFWVYISVYGIFALVSLNFHYIDKDFNVLKELSRKQRDFINLCDSLQAGSTIEIDRLKPDVLSFVSNSPEAIVNSLFRPHILEIKKPLYIFAAIETFVTFILIVLILAFRNSQYESNFVLFCFSIVICISLLVGLLTPVLGTIIRYKMPLLPFFGALFCNLFDEKKFFNKINFIFNKTKI